MTSSLLVSIDRTSLSLGALALPGSNDGSTGMHIVSFSPPARQSRNVYMPDSESINGSEIIATSEQQAILGFNVKMTSATETALRTSYNTLVAAIKQFRFAVTTTQSGAPAEVWAADPGSIQLADPTGRTFADSHNLNPVYSVSIPVYPVAS